MTSSKKNNNNKSANSQPNKVINLGKTAPAQDNSELLAQITALKAQLNREQEARAVLETKVKASVNRGSKAPEAFDVLRGLSVCLRSYIGKAEPLTDAQITALHEMIVKDLGIIMNSETNERLFLKTVAHNSFSNIRKAQSKANAEGRRIAWLEMVEQGKILYNLSEAFTSNILAEYEKIYSDAIKNLV